jgi:hypothetical protein
MMRRTLAFVLLLVVLDLGLAALLARGFARQRSGASGGLANQAIAVEAPLLILGSSRAQHHLDPRILGEAAGLRAWNAGADGQGLCYAASLLDLLERRWEPRLVVWSLDRKDFDPRERPSQLQRLSVLLPHYAASPLLRRLWRSQGYEARLKVQVRTYRFNSLALPMLASLFRPPLPPSDGGFVPAPARPGPPAPGPREDYETPDERALATLQKSVERLAARGAEVVLLTGPRWAPEDPPTAFYDAIDRRIEDLAQGIPHVTFWRMDEAALPEFRDPGLFIDAGHLNAEGAKRLSALVAGRIRAEIRPRLEAGSR